MNYYSHNIYLISAKSSSPEFRMICFFSTEMSVGPSSDLVNLSGGNWAVAISKDIHNVSITKNLNAIVRKSGSKLHYKLNWKPILMYSTISDAKNLIDEALICELSSKRGEKIYSSVQEQQMINLRLRHVARSLNVLSLTGHATNQVPYLFGCWSLCWYSRYYTKQTLQCHDSLRCLVQACWIIFQIVFLEIRGRKKKH